MYTLQEFIENVTIKKLPNGNLLLSILTDDGYIIDRQYMGYTKKEALKNYYKWIYNQ